MLRALAARARTAGASRLRMLVATGPRNTPARQFHARIFVDEGGSVPLAPLLSLMPADESPAWKAEEDTAPTPQAPVAPPFAAIAHHLRTAAAIEAAARRQRRDTATGPAPFVAAQGATEQLIARQFAEVLGTSPVGAHDSFFALGGDSVSAVRLVARLRDQLQMEIPLMAVFERERVNELAARIDLMQAAAGRIPQDMHGAVMTEGAL